ncbi:MAG: glycoside hydrolase family 43 protein [Bacteroides sp.]|nr:glycoside hydrolase family 43 protein [Bacteroides sp.]
MLCLISCNRLNQAKTEHPYKLIIGWRMQEVTTLPFDSLIMNDPFILADDVTKTYYMTGSGGTLWKSPDLKMWTGPYSYIEVDTTSWMGSNPLIWAPELHIYNGKYYCFTTFTNTGIIVDTVPNRYCVQRRASHILVSDKAEGPYRPINDNIYLPENWSTLDGTLWEENGKPYLVFSHEWMQTIDGRFKYIELAPDLSGSVGESIYMFKGSDAPWPREMRSIGELTFGMSLDGYVTDGPFLFRTGTGRLGMLWSSWSDQCYAQGVAYSTSGSLAGPWIQMETPLVPENSGHSMLFKTFEGKQLMLLHYQGLEENPGPRKPRLLEMDLSGNELQVIGIYNP